MLISTDFKIKIQFFKLLISRKNLFYLFLNLNYGIDLLNLKFLFFYLKKNKLKKKTFFFKKLQSNHPASKKNIKITTFFFYYKLIKNINFILFKNINISNNDNALIHEKNDFLIKLFKTIKFEIDEDDLKKKSFLFLYSSSFYFLNFYFIISLNRNIIFLHKLIFFWNYLIKNKKNLINKKNNFNFIFKNSNYLTNNAAYIKNNVRNKKKNIFYINSLFL